MNRKLLGQLLDISDTSDQLRQIMEEAGEVIQEICKLDRCPTRNFTKLLEEMGDLTNAIESVLYALDVNKDEFDNARYKKIENFIGSYKQIQAIEGVVKGVQENQNIDENKCNNGICNTNPTPTKTPTMRLQEPELLVSTVVSELNKTMHEVEVHDISTVTSSFVIVDNNDNIMADLNDVNEILVMNPINDIMTYVYKVMRKEIVNDVFIFDIVKIPRGHGYIVKLILI